MNAVKVKYIFFYYISGKLKYVCCADQEEKGNACIRKL